MDFRSLIQSLDTIKESVQQPAVRIINDFNEVVDKFDTMPKGFRDALRSSEFDAVQWLADIMRKDPDFDITTIEKIVLRPGVYGPDEHVIDVTEYLDHLGESIHKGTYGNSYGKEDVRDQYGHKVGKINKGAEDKKDEPKKGRGRPKKGAGTSGEHKTYDTSTLGSVFGGGKKPSKEVGKKSVKHSLKEYIEEAESALNEDATLAVKPLTGASEITMNNEPTGITAKDPQAAIKIKDLMSTGDISLPGAGGADAGTSNSLGEDEFDSEEHGSHDPSEYGMEGDYVKNQLHTIARVTQHLEEKLSDEEDLPEWVQEKVSQAKGMMVGVMDYIASEKERDVERETGEEGVISEKAKSKAQQRFFGMVHSMQKGKKVPGASKELKGVAKDIGKKDAKDFAKTKHKGLPDHVSEQEGDTSFGGIRADIGSGGVKSKYYPPSKAPVKKFDKPTRRFDKYMDKNSPLDDTEFTPDQSSRPYLNVREGEKPHPKELEMIGKTREMGVQNRGRDAEQRMANRAAEPKNFMQKVKQDIGGPLSKLAKGDFKGAFFEEAKDLPGKQDKLDVAKPKGKLDAKDFAALRAKKKVKESTDMKITQLTEGMKDLLINFYDDVTSHKGDTTVFDLKKAQNVQQAEEVLKALVKHSDNYSHLSLANQNLIVADALRQFAHDPDLPFNKKSKDPFANLDSQRFTNRTPKNMSGYTQHPGAKPGSDFSKPGSPMAVPRTTPTTGSNGFLKTLSTPQTFNEGNNMKDKQFESWEQELNSLLTEGITVSHSTGQQGSPDSLSINATEHDAGELMSILRNSGMEMFGGKQQEVGYGSPEHNGEEGGEEEFHQGVEIAPSPDVVGDGDDMLALIKKMSGIASDSNTPGSVEVDDYADEEGDEDRDEESHDDEEGDEEEISELTAEYPGGSTPLPEGDMDENLEVRVNPAGASSAEQAKELGAQFPQQGGKEPNLAYKIGEGDMEEGNKFTEKLKKTPKGGTFSMGGKQYTDTSSIEEGGYDPEQRDGGGAGAGDIHMEGQEDCNECGYPMESCGCEHVEEGYSNDAGGDAMGDTELMQLKELLSMGNDLHREKRTQSTGNIQKVTMETKLLKDSTSLLTDWKKLSGIK